MNYERRRPQLAQGKQPFTPISHKNGKNVETPYEPLKLNDLVTPKGNRSGLAAEKRPVSYEDVQNNDLAELKAVLLKAVRVVERMERKQVMKSVATQTGQQQKPAARKRFEATEVNLSGSDSSDVSPVVNKRHAQKAQAKPVAQRSGLSSSSDRKSGGNDLEQRMRDMSLLIKRLENQLDTIDVPK